MISLQERVLGVEPPSRWKLTKLRFVFRLRSGNKNVGMIEDNLLSLSYGRIVRRDISSSEGLLPESFETYQIVKPGDIVLRLTDLQNDKKSLRQGLVMERGIVTSAYDALTVAVENDPRFWFYTLLSLDLAKFYYSLGGGVRQSIKFGDFPNEWLRQPDRHEQTQIADFIEHEIAEIDEVIDCLGGAVVAKNSSPWTLPALLSEKRNATIMSAVTGQIDIASHSNSGTARTDFDTRRAERTE